MLTKHGMERYFLNTTEIYEKPFNNIMLNGERLKTFLLKSGMRQTFLFLPLLLNRVWKFQQKQLNKKKNK